MIEGRDIGTVVFPDAELKVYLTADPEVRASRRAGRSRDLDYEAVAADLARRDALDQGREHSPLTQADDAVVVDTTDRSIDEIVDRITGPARGEPAARGGAEAAGSGSCTGSCGARPARLRQGLVPPVGRGPGARARGPAVHPRADPPLEHRLPARARLCPRAPLRYMGKDTLWKSKGWGRLFTAARRLPGAPGHRRPRGAAHLHRGDRAGRVPGDVPRGHPPDRPGVAHMFDGPAFVQSRTGAPILPVGIGGSETAMPKGAKFIKPRKITVVIGEPLEPPVPDESGKVRRHAVREQTAALGEEIQDLFDEAQRQAGTPNRRDVRG